MSCDIHTLAQRHLPGEDYTVTRKEFTDGDTRTTAKYTYGWSHDNYVDITLWKGTGDVWVEYYEHDVRRNREIYGWKLKERIV